jgi:hypothetical protein
MECAGQVKIEKKKVIYGSSKKKNIEDASADAQGREPLARAATEQVRTVRQQRALAHGLPVVRLLQGPPGSHHHGGLVRFSKMFQPFRDSSGTAEIFC